MQPAIRPWRIGICTGEPSGDLLAAELIEALKERHPALELEGIIGPRLAAMGAKILVPMQALSVMGFWEPLKRLPTLWSYRRALIRHWTQHPPDLVITVDAPDFNLGLANILKKKGIRVIHCVSPSVWAWRPGRVFRVAASVDHLLTLFPFEAAYYQKTNLKVSYVGHPLADRVVDQDKEALRAKLSIPLSASKVIALLPGSRDAEITRHFPLFLEAVHLLWMQHLALAHSSTLYIVIAAVNAEKAADMEDYVQRHYPEWQGLYRIVISDTPTAVGASDVVLVVSGTATLETMLCERPMVVAYKMSALNYWIAQRLIQTPFIALPNILAARLLVPECIQEACSAERLALELSTLLAADNTLLIAEMQRIKKLLQQGAAQKAADVIGHYCSI